MKYILSFFISIVCFSNALAQGFEHIAESDFEIIVNNCEFIFDTSAQNIWQIGAPQKPFFNTAYSVPNAIMTDTINPYPINNYSSFILKFANNPTTNYDYMNYTSLSFWHKHQTDSLKDFGQMFFSIDNGLTWIPMVDTFGIESPDSTSSFPEYASFWWNYYLQTGFQNEVTGTSDWTFSKYEWDWYITIFPRDDYVTPDTILIKFEFATDSVFDSNDGWLIDNIVVERTMLSGISDPYNTEMLQIYPNPASDIVYFALGSGKTIQTIFLRNQLGQLVKSKEINSRQDQIQVSGLPKGNYLLQAITSDGRQGTLKVLIQ